RAVQVDHVHVLATVHLALHDAGDGGVEGTGGRVLARVADRDDLGDKHLRGGHGGGDVVDQGGQPVGRVPHVEVLQHVVGADVQQHGVRLEPVEPTDDVGVDLVDAPAGVALVVV